MLVLFFIIRLMHMLNTIKVKLEPLGVIIAVLRLDIFMARKALKWFLSR
jgi:hypothetical protein